jgi:hypothetical protein
MHEAKPSAHGLAGYIKPHEIGTLARGSAPQMAAHHLASDTTGLL